MILPIIVYVLISIIMSLVLLDTFEEIMDGLFSKKGMKVKHLVLGILFLPGTLLVMTVYFSVYLVLLFSESSLFEKLKNFFNKQIF